jgi:competence protein ComEC
LLWWLPLLSRGHLLRSAVVICAIWLYASVAGFTPSVTRAAVMFTVMQAAIQLSSRSISANTLCFTAVVMLSWDARMIYDAGFLLSLLSVAAIIEWAVPLCTRLQRPNSGLLRQAAWWGVEWLRSAFVVSLVASVATAPLVAYLFGRFSLWGVVAGPLMVALTAAAVGSVVVWVLLPIGVLQGVASEVIGSLIGTMNNITAWCARAEVMSFEWQAEGWVCAGAYILFAFITLTAWAIEKKY